MVDDDDGGQSNPKIKTKGNPTEKSFLDTWNTLPSNFRYMVIGLGVLLISTRIIHAGPSHIFAIIAIYFIITRLQQQETSSTMSFNDEMDYKLDILGSPSNMHRDANLINLFFNMYGWRSRNANNFDNALKAVNNILQIESDSEKPLKRCVDNYDIAYDQKNIAMNLMHGFIYSIDNPLLVVKLKKFLQKLQQLLEKHLLAIQSNCDSLEKDKGGIDVNTRFIEDAYGPKPYDGASMSQFDYY